MDYQKVGENRRTSLIVDPASGKIPPQLPQAIERAAKRPKSSSDDPEVVGLDERCLLSAAFDSSNSSPPLVPNVFGLNIYQIVQTPQYVMLFSELVHDARIVRINGKHPPASLQNWLGRFDRQVGGDTLVVDYHELHRQDPLQRLVRNGSTSSSDSRGRIRTPCNTASRSTIRRHGRRRGPPRWRSRRLTIGCSRFARHEANYAMIRHPPGRTRRGARGRKVNVPRRFPRRALHCLGTSHDHHRTLHAGARRRRRRADRIVGSARELRRRVHRRRLHVPGHHRDSLGACSRRRRPSAAQAPALVPPRRDGSRIDRSDPLCRTARRSVFTRSGCSSDKTRKDCLRRRRLKAFGCGLQARSGDARSLLTKSEACSPKPEA